MSHLLGPRVLRFVLSGAMLLVSLDAPSSAEWSDPFRIGTSVFPPTVAVGAAGDPLLAWINAAGEVRVRTRSSAGVLGASELVGDRGFAVEAAADSDGNALLAWISHDGSSYLVLGRARSADGELGPLELYQYGGQPSMFDLHVVMAPNGHAVVSWYDWATGRVHARRRSPGGVVTAQTVGAADHGHRVGIDEAGTVVFAWRVWDGESYRARARVWPVMGTIGAVETLSPAGATVQDVRVSVGYAGSGLFAWVVRVNDEFRIQARARTAKGSKSPVQSITPFVDQPVAALELARDLDGGTLIVWSVQSDRVRARVRSSAGDLSPTQTLSADWSGALEIGTDRDDRTVIVWAEPAGARSRLSARTRTPDGALSPITELGETSSAHRVAIDAAGNAFVVYGVYPTSDSEAMRIFGHAGP